MPCIPNTGDWASPSVDRDALHDWVSSLPWVVERPYSVGVRGVRVFAVDCEPLGVRRIWLVTGLPNSSGIAVIVPASVAEDFDILNLARPLAPMPPGHVLATLSRDADRYDTERVVIEAYSDALGWRLLPGAGSV